MSVLDKILNVVTAPLASPAACSKDQERTPGIEPNYIELSRAEASAIMSTGREDLDECRLHDARYLEPFGSSVRQRIATLWRATAYYIITVKYNRPNAPENLRNAVRHLADNQIEAVVEHLARELNPDQADEYLIETLTPEQLEAYQGYCQRSYFLFAPDYPEPITLAVTEERLLEIINCVSQPLRTPEGHPNNQRPPNCEGIAYVPPGGAPSRLNNEMVITYLRDLDELARRELLGDMLPPAESGTYFAICSISPNSKRPRSLPYQIEIRGKAINLFDENKQLPEGLKVSFGDGIKAGQVTATSQGNLSVSIVISPSAQPGYRNVVITLGEGEDIQEIGRKDNGFKVLRGGGSTDPCKGSNPPEYCKIGF